MNTVSHNGFLLVEVPEGYHSFTIEHDNVLQYLGGIGEIKNQTLPPGNYSIVGLAKELSREQKMEIEPKGTAAFNRLLVDNKLSNPLILKKN